MYYGLKQGQITQNIDNRYVLKLIHLVAQCSKITNTVLFLKRILNYFPAFFCFLLVMSECPKVHFVALRFICHLQKYSCVQNLLIGQGGGTWTYKNFPISYMILYQIIRFCPIFKEVIS